MAISPTKGRPYIPSLGDLNINVVTFFKDEMHKFNNIHKDQYTQGSNICKDMVGKVFGNEINMILKSNVRG